MAGYKGIGRREISGFWASEACPIRNIIGHMSPAPRIYYVPIIII